MYVFIYKYRTKRIIWISCSFMWKIMCVITTSTTTKMTMVWIHIIIQDLPGFYNKSMDSTGNYEILQRLKPTNTQISQVSVLFTLDTFFATNSGINMGKHHGQGWANCIVNIGIYNRNQTNLRRIPMET